MNALERQVAEFITATRAAEFVTVDSFCLEPLRGEADYVLAALSNGKQLSVRWSQDFDTAILLLAGDDESEGREVTAGETGLSSRVLASLVDFSNEAYRDWWAEGMAASEEMGVHQSGCNEEDNS